MNCQYVSENLSAYIDGELNKKESKAVAEHLLVCHHCRSQWEELKAASALIRELPEVTPPPEFKAGLNKRLASIPAPVADNDDKVSITEKVSSITRKPWYKIAAVAAVFTMVMGVSSLWSTTNGDFDFVGPQLSRTETPELQVLKNGQSNNEVAPTTNKDGKSLNKGQLPPGDKEVAQPAGGAQGDSQETSPDKPVSGSDEAVPDKNNNGKPEANNTLSSPAVVMTANHKYVATSSNLTIAVEDVNAAATKAAAIAKKYGGTVSYGNTLNMYIPVANYYSGFIGELKSLGELTESTTSEDVSAEIQALEKQLAQKQQIEAVLLQDEEQNEQQLDTVQAEIKQLRNQIQSLKADTKNVKVVLKLVPAN